MSNRDLIVTPDINSSDDGITPEDLAPVEWDEILEAVDAPMTTDAHRCDFCGRPATLYHKTLQVYLCNDRVGCRMTEAQDEALPWGVWQDLDEHESPEIVVLSK